ncbi:MAG TPA: DegT/DnrJ/EryC1/StrS family aminotransferase [Anaerolineales bacterium]
MEQQIPLVDLKAQYGPLEEQIRKAWDGVLASMQLFLGPNVRAFEQEFAQYCGVEHAIGVGDGTSAIQLALRAAEIGPGDEVITVSHTFIATGEAILLAGATPVFVDIDPQTLLMDVSQVEAQITPRTRAILPVHLYGQCVDMDPLLDIARRHNLLVIEDACQAHGAEYKGRKAGSLGDMAAFSFYFTKNLGAYGEGGMVTTRNGDLAKRIRMLRDHGSEKRYYHEFLGTNGRLDELQAAALRVKLPHLDEWNAQRRANAELYRQGLKDVAVTLPVDAPGSTPVYHLYVIRTPQREGLRAHLNECGIGTGIHYPVPIHQQQVYAKLGLPIPSLPVTEQAVTEILSLPMYADLKSDQIERVTTEIKRFIIEPMRETIG